MLIRTVVTLCHLGKKGLATDEMLRLKLAQNVTETRDGHLQGDWVDPTLLGITCDAYLTATLTLQHGVGCRCHVETN